MRYTIFLSILLIAGISGITGCEKSFLDKKPSSQIIVPKTLDDFQKLADNMYLLTASPALPLLSSDDYFFSSDAVWQATTAVERNSYVWAKDIYNGRINIDDWNYPYKAVFYSNVILDGLKDVSINAGNAGDWSQIKGSALFTRGYSNYNLLDCFAMPYDEATAASDPGIPIRLSSNIDEIAQRSSVAQSYQQVIDDVTQAIPLLSATVPASNRNRPSKPAAYALLARVYLSMRKYDKAELYADSTLTLYNKLIDYNSISQTSTTPFTINNDETIVRYTTVNAYAALSISSTTSLIDSNLVKEYKTNDLRKAIYFRVITGGFGIKRGYAGNGTPPFTGLATDEVYLIKAECLARRNMVPESMAMLNSLLVKRYRTNFFVAATANDRTEALDVVLKERRKELVFRGARWSDVRRLNKEGANIVMKRFVNGALVELKPNSPLYALPIPDDEIAASGIQQNVR